MELSTQQKLGLGAGIVFVILGGLGAALYPADAPGFVDEPAAIAAFYAEHSTEVRSSAVIYLVGSIPLLVFFGAWRRLLAGAEGSAGWLATTAFGAGVAGVAVLLVGGTAELGAVLRVEERGAIDASTATVAGDLSALTWGLGAPMAFATFLLATAAVAWRTAVLPRWFAALTALLAVALAIPPISWIAIYGFLAWVVVAVVIAVFRPLGASSRVDERDDSLAAAGA